MDAPEPLAISELAPGIRALEHTADVGLELHADSFSQLLERAAHGLLLLLRGTDDIPEDAPAAPAAAAPQATSLTIDAADPPALLVCWLRELLWRYQARQLAFVRAEFTELTSEHIVAEAWFAPEAQEPEREIKGVTWHALVAEPREQGWFARVIFDV